MTAKRYASEEALLADMFGTVNGNVVSVDSWAPEPTSVDTDFHRTPQPHQQEMWTEDYVRRAATSEQIFKYAEVIAQLFEDPELTPNLVVWQQDDNPLAPAEWRKAAKRAGKLLNRKVSVFKSRGRMTAVLEQNEEEKAAERERMGHLFDDEIPPPLPRNFRDGG